MGDSLSKCSVLLAAFLVSLAGARVALSSEATELRRVSGRDFDGVVIPTATSGSWSLSDSQVAKIESELEDHVSAQKTAKKRVPSCPLTQFKRQYWPFSVNDRRMVRVQFFHESTTVVTGGRWLTARIQVDDGGDRYFSAKYDVESQAFVDFHVDLEGQHCGKPVA